MEEKIMQNPKYSLKLAERLNYLGAIKHFFWELDNADEVPEKFWNKLYENAEKENLKGYCNLIKYYQTGQKPNNKTNNKTIEEKIEMLKQPHYAHNTETNKIESILKHGLLSYALLEKTIENPEHGVWGRSRSNHFVYNSLKKINPNYPNYKTIGGKLNACINQELNNEMFSDGVDETIYPGMISVDDIIGFAILNYFGETNTADIDKNIESQYRILENPKKHGIPIITNNKEIIKP